MHSGFDEFIFLFTYSNSLSTKYPELRFEIVARTFVLFPTNFLETAVYLENLI